MNESDYFNSREEGYCRRLLTWCDYSSENHDPNLYIEYLKNLKLVNYRPECHFLIRLYRRAGYDLSCFQETSWLRYEKPDPVTQASSLVLKGELEQALSLLCPHDQVGFYLMAGTGRRACDINRLIIIPRQCSPRRLTFRLPHQKNGNTHTIIEFNPDESELVLPNDIQRIRAVYSGGKLPDFDWNRIRRITRLKLHSMRNRFAIRLMIKGVSEGRIMERLGWRDPRSLRRYIRLSFDFVSAQTSADAVVTMLRELY